MNDMKRIQCFWIEPTGREIHRAMSWKWLGDSGEVCAVHGSAHRAEGDPQFEPLPDGALGPETCACGYRFNEDQRREKTVNREYHRPDTGEIVGRPFPVGAMWDAEWLKFEGMGQPSESPRLWHVGADGRILVVMTPGGEWIIDSRAANCTMPEDNEHRCWVRHGEPPRITVDKNGLTCNAGAGSIQCRDYHGFLRGGFLEGC